ncbi:hypothetical protein BASA81_007136 [Batrachochytrium salamandrivorans]|nr:hypothetical protein BASA81_007136 [Batrachochytrium salamandrivorans]
MFSQNEEQMACIDLTGDGGVMKEIKREGQGAFPQPGDEIRAHYVGTLQSNGTQFDSSRQRGKEFTFILGQGQVIQGWDKGFASMKKGELAVLTLDPKYGYGRSGAGGEWVA